MLTVKYAETCGPDLHYVVTCADLVKERVSECSHLIDLYRYPTGISGGTATVCETIRLGEGGDGSGTIAAVFVENMAGKTVQKFSHLV